MLLSLLLDDLGDDGAVSALYQVRQAEGRPEKRSCFMYRSWCIYM